MKRNKNRMKDNRDINDIKKLKKNKIIRMEVKIGMEGKGQRRM